MTSKQLFKLALALIISLFLYQSGTAQSLTLPRNNCFTDVERDSILSKLLAKEYFENQFISSEQALIEADIIINTLTEKDSLNRLILAERKKSSLQKKLRWQKSRPGRVRSRLPVSVFWRGLSWLRLYFNVLFLKQGRL